MRTVKPMATKECDVVDPPVAKPANFEDVPIRSAVAIF